MNTIDDHLLSKHPIKRIALPNLTYAYLEKGEGPAVLLLHGFPDMAGTWDEVMDRLADAGYRAIAPFLRGYYPTDTVEDMDYSVYSIAEDQLELLTALGVEKVYVIGHDWGASIAYMLANIAPERVTKLVTLAIPHPRVIKPSLGLFLKARHFILYQFKDYAYWYTSRNNFAYLDYIYNYWAPNWEISKAEKEVMKCLFSLPGRLEAAIGYYHSLTKDIRNKERQRMANKKTVAPTLCFAGDADGAINLDLFYSMDSAFENGLQLEVLETIGHFPHREDLEVFMEKVVVLKM